MSNRDESTRLISGYEIPISIIRKKIYRRCTMKMIEGVLQITIPIRYESKLLDKFITKHSSWILKQYYVQKNRADNLPKLIDNDKIPFKGKFYSVKLTQESSINFIDGIFYIPNIDSKYELLNQWYINESLNHTKLLIERWHKKLGKGLKVINLKNMRSRWGSCSYKGNISLNWRLILAPEEVFEYVFIHELSHLEIKSHAENFWKLVETHIKNVKYHRKWLRNKSFVLSNFPTKITTSAIVAKIIL